MGDGFNPMARVAGVLPASRGPANSQLPPLTVVVDTRHVKAVPVEVI
jgi:hypothetical protein